MQEKRGTVDQDDGKHDKVPLRGCCVKLRLFVQKTVANKRKKLKEERKRKALVRQAQEADTNDSSSKKEEPHAKKPKQQVNFSKVQLGASDGQKKKAKPTAQQLLHKVICVVIEKMSK